MLTGELDSADVCLHHGPFRASALVVDGMRCKYCWPEQGKLNHCGLEWMRHHYSVCISWAGRHFCLRVTREKRTSFAFSWSSVTARPWIVTMCVCVLARLQSCSNPLTLRACVCVCVWVFRMIGLGSCLPVKRVTWSWRNTLTPSAPGTSSSAAR